MSSEIFCGDRLQIAREFRGLTQKQLCLEVAASPALVSLCEAGKKKDPAVDLVEAFGAILGFEPPFFYRRVEDPFREDECSFRHRRTTPERLKSQIRAHATLIGFVLDKLRLVLSFPELNVPQISASKPEEIERAAESCRQHWGIGTDGPILHVGRVLEHAGVVIVTHVVKSAKVDAFSRFGPTTIIFLNQVIPSTSRWIFDVGHECGHLVMHRGLHTGDLETEAQANRFASSFLMPRKAFSRELGMADFGWEHVFDLKKRWRVSAAAIVKRAYDLGLIGAVQYRRAFQYMSFKGWNKGEPYEPTFQPPEILRSALSSLGTGVELTLSTLCHQLHFLPNTFHEVTGVSIPIEKVKPGTVIQLGQKDRSRSL
jgi:Zn-dependent peptidase ImmA (M78 family)/transcriptional regulator with XRE-family HTH domain